MCSSDLDAVYAPVVDDLERRLEIAREALEAAMRYDTAIQEYGATGDVGFKQDGTSYAVGDDLDALYADWIDKSRTALAQLGAPASGEEKA